MMREDDNTAMPKETALLYSGKYKENRERERERERERDRVSSPSWIVDGPVVPVLQMFWIWVPRPGRA